MGVDLYIVEVRGRGITQTTQQLRNMGTAADSVRKTLGFLRAALVVFASIQILGGLVRLLDKFTELNNKVRQYTRTQEEANAILNRLRQISDATRTPLEGNVSLFQELARALESTDVTYRQLTDAIENLAIAVRVSSPDTQIASKAFIQLGQAMSGSTRISQELISIIEGLPEVASLIADEIVKEGHAFSGARGAMVAFNQAHPGVINAQLLLNAFVNKNENLLRKFSATLPTIQDGFTRLNTAIIFFIGRLNQATTIGAYFYQTLVLIADNIDKVAIALGALLTLFVFNFAVAQLAALNATILALGRFGFRSFGILAAALSALLAPLTLVYVGISGLGTVIISLARTIRTALIPAFILLKVIIVSVRATLISMAVTWNLMIALSAGLSAAIGVLVAVFGSLGAAFAVGVATIAAITAGILLMGGSLSSLIPTLDQVKSAFDNVVAFFGAAYDVIVNQWELLPGAFRSIGIDIGNALIEGIEKALNSIVAQINDFRRKYLEVRFQIPFTNTTVGLDTKPGTTEPITIPRLAPAATEDQKAAQDVLERFQKRYNEILQTKPAESTIAFFKDMLALLKEFATAGAIPPEILDLFAPKKGTGNANAELDDLKDKFLSLIASVSPYAEALIKLEKVDKLVADAQSKHIDINKKYGISIDDIKTRTIRAVIGVGNAVTDYKETVRLLDEQQKKGNVSTVEYAATLRKLKEDTLGLAAAGELAASVSPLAATRRELDAARETLDLTAERARAAGQTIEEYLGTKPAEVMRRLIRNIIGVGNAVDDYNEKLRILKDNAKAAGASQEELKEKSEALRREILGLGAAIQLAASLDPLIAANERLRDATLTLNNAERNGIDILKETGLTRDEINRRLLRDLVGVGNAATDYAAKVALLKKANDAGALSAEEFARAARELKIEFLSTKFDAASGFERGLLRLQNEFEDVATQIEGAMRRAFQGMEDALYQFITTGKLNFSDLARSIIADIVRISIRAAILGPLIGLITGSTTASAGVAGGGFLGVLGSLFGFGGGIGTPGFAGGPGLPAGGSLGTIGTQPFADGGSFTIGSRFPYISGGRDNRIVAFRGEDGEQVTVTPKGKRRPGAVVNVRQLVIPDMRDQYGRSRGAQERAINNRINTIAGRVSA